MSENNKCPSIMENILFVSTYQHCKTSCLGANVKLFDRSVHCFSKVKAKIQSI